MPGNHAWEDPYPMTPGEGWFACPHTALEVVRSWQVGDCRRKVRCVTVAVEGLAELAPETMGSVSCGGRSQEKRWDPGQRIQQNALNI